jgi:isopropylmalate/homocitrate/citramalate synthase
MEETVLALLTMYGIDTGIDFSKLNELSKLVQELSGVQIPSGRPFIGEGAYTIESGIVTGWFKNVFESHPTTVFPVHPDFVGHAAPQIVMGKKSGLDNVEIWSKRLGIELSEEQANALLQEIKLRSHDLKRVLSEEEFREMAEKIQAKN